MLNGQYELGLSALLEHDLSSYEYFNALPPKIKEEIVERDAHSFEEMQTIAAEMRRRR